VPVLTENRDLKVHKGHKVYRAKPGMLVRKVPWGLRVQRVHKVHKVHKGKKVIREMLDQRV
jgi:hypothetical protein